MNQISKQQIRKELIAFFLLAYFITWSMAGVLLLTNAPEFPTVLPLIYGPSIAAIILTAVFYGKAGLRSFFKRYLQFKVSWKWYAFLIVGFVAIGYGGKWLWSLTGDDRLYLGLASFSSMIPVIIMQLFVPGLGEEPGWRGFGLYRLQALYSPLKASLIIGLIHWLWHLPTFWLGTGMHNVPAIWSILYVLPLTILFTWTYNHTRGSIAIAALFHGLHGVMLSLVSFLPSEALVPITPDLLTSFWVSGNLLGPYLVVVIILWALSIAIIKGAFGGLGQPPAFRPVTD